jgi:hypothetical protein
MTIRRRRWLRGTRPGDWLLLVFLLSLAGAAQLYLARTGTTGEMAEVLVDSEIRARIALDRPGTTWIEGRLGPVELVVEGGAIRVADAPCPHKVCIRMGAKRRAGDTIVCVPSHLVVRIIGTPDARPVDAITQ